MSAKLTGYSLTRNWFVFAGDNADKLCPTHTAMYLYLVDLNNSLGWKKTFYANTKIVMHHISLKSYNTYSKVFNDLVSFGFIEIVEKSRNQFTTNVIALSNPDKTFTKASAKQNESTEKTTLQSIDSINKLVNIKTKETKKYISIENKNISDILLTETIWLKGLAKRFKIDVNKINEFFTEFFESHKIDGNEKISKTYFRNWVNSKKLGNQTSNSTVVKSNAKIIGR